MITTLNKFDISKFNVKNKTIIAGIKFFLLKKALAHLDKMTLLENN
jgi:hypothetical protein